MFIQPVCGHIICADLDRCAFTEQPTRPSCRACDLMPAGRHCLSHTCPDCGQRADSVAAHRC